MVKALFGDCPFFCHLALGITFGMKCSDLTVKFCLFHFVLSRSYTDAYEQGGALGASQYTAAAYHHHLAAAAASNPSGAGSGGGGAGTTTTPSANDFSNYGPMYSYYSNKCRTAPYQRPTSLAAAAGQQHLAAAAAAAMYYGSTAAG